MGAKYKKFFLTSLAAVIVAFSVSLFVGGHPVFADRPANPPCNPTTEESFTKDVGGNQQQWCRDKPGTTNPTTGTGTGDAVTDAAAVGEITCAIEKMGWVLCPLIETAGDIGDKAFQLLANHFLETEPELVASVTGAAPSGTYIAWEMARNIANILFIIAFLIIIYSQVTGAGLNNYGIKKMLPRLIIAVIAVNASYYICQLIVDLTNILGYTIKDFLVETSLQVSDRAAMPTAAANQSASQTAGNGILKAIALGALGMAGIVMLILPMLGVSILAIVIACLAIVVILMMRKAFIVLLVVLAPIAFVAYLLPNTERYFKKWASMFWNLLLVFPVVALLFGGGQLASAIVLIAGTNRQADTAVNGTSVYELRDANGQKCVQLPYADPNNSSTKTATVGACGTGSTPFMLGLTAALIAVAPLFAVWSVLKGALSAAGSIGGKIGGTISNLGDKAGRGARKPEDWAKKTAFGAAGTAVATRAYKNNWRGFRAARRFQKRGERAKSALEAAQAGFDASEAGAGDIRQQINRNKAATAAANEGLNEEYIKSINAGRLNIGDALGQNVGVAGKAIDAQETRAMAEAVKAIKEGTDTTDLAGIERAFVNALRHKDMATARAMQDILLTSGSAGMKAFHSGYAAGGVTAGSDMDTSLRQNVLSNHGAAKSSDASVKEWSERGGASLTDHWNDSGTWNGVDTVQKFAALSKTAQRQAVAKMDPAQMGQIVNGLRASPDALKSIDLDVRTTYGI